MLHPLLARQLGKLGIDAAAAPPEWAALLERVSQRYTEADHERYRLERSIQICSEEMSELNQSLASERDQLRAIFDGAAVGIARGSMDGRIVECNPAYAHMLGRSRDEIIGHRWDEFVHDASEHATPMAHDRPLNISERRYVHKNGSIVWASVGVSTVRDSNGKPLFNIAVVADRTQERQLEVSLRHAQKLEAVGRLAAGIAHEINTPIQFVGDNLAFLRSALESALSLHTRIGDLVAAEKREELAKLADELDLAYIEQQVPQAIQQSLDGVEHITKIVQAMRFMSHYQRPDDLTMVDVNTTLKNVVTVASPETKYVADVHLDLGEISPILGSSTDLNQVFLNLVVNAAHAVGAVMEETGRRGAIRVNTWMEDAVVAVAIADTGTGIPPAVRDRIFDPFFTTKDVGKGTGQGLAIARTVVTKHGGSIAFQTEVGAGTTFVVRLPVRPAQRDAA